VVPSSGSCRSASSLRSSRNRSLDTKSCVSRCVASSALVEEEVDERGADASASADVAASNSSVLAEEQVVVVVVMGDDVVADVVRYVNIALLSLRRRAVDDSECIGDTVVHASKGTASEPKKTAMTAKEADAQEEEDERIRTAERAMVGVFVVGRRLWAR
jgi:hypothetical protein